MPLGRRVCGALFPPRQETCNENVSSCLKLKKVLGILPSSPATASAKALHAVLSLLGLPKTLYILDIHKRMCTRNKLPSATPPLPLSTPHLEKKNKSKKSKKPSIFTIIYQGRISSASMDKRSAPLQAFRCRMVSPHYFGGCGKHMHACVCTVLPLYLYLRQFLALKSLHHGAFVCVAVCVATHSPRRPSTVTRDPTFKTKGYGIPF